MVLVSIVGDFDSSILPILYEFKSDVTKHILVHDMYKNDIANAKKIKKGIKRFKKKYGYNFKTLEYAVDEDSLNSLIGCAKYLLSQTAVPNELYVNTTDGFSTLTTILNQALFKKGVNFIAYDRYDNEYNLLNSTTLTKFSLEHCMNIEEHFLLKGYRTQKSDNAQFAKQHKKVIRKLFETHKESYDAFIKHPNTNNKVYELSKEYNVVKELFTSMGLSKIKIKDPILTGTLFEAYIFNLLKKLPYDDIEIGLKIFRNYKTTEIENEFDILIMKNNHLHMIECKYKNQVKLEELIYKYAALSAVIDDDAKMLLVTKKSSQYSSAIDLDKSQGRVYKRGILSNITVLGGVSKNPQKFVSNVINELCLK